MTMRIPTATFCFTLIVSAFAQTPPEIEWQRCLGGTSIDYARSIIQCTDGTYVVVGTTNSTNGDAIGNDGGYDMWVVKLDSNGDLVWQKTYGGSGVDAGYFIQETNDGGYVAIGGANSSDGDLTENHGDEDIWVVKLNDVGVIQWQRVIGGSAYDVANGLTPTSDNGYMITGTTSSIDGDVTNNHGGMDAWVIKISENGDIQWQQTYGGSEDDSFAAVTQTSDDGSLIVGTTSSNDGDVVGNHGSMDLWVVKLDAEGGMVWQNALGGSLDEQGVDIKETSDGGCIVVGSTGSSNGDVLGFNGGLWDAWVIKLNITGELWWQACFGGASIDNTSALQLTADGGAAVLCRSNSMNGDVTEPIGGTDYWLVRVDEDGDLLWERSYGGTLEDSPSRLFRTMDGGYALTGYTKSNNGDVSGNHGGLYDGWAMKLGADPTAVHEYSTSFELQAFPNPFRDQLFLSLSLDRSTLIGYTLLDATGQVCSRIAARTHPAGNALLPVHADKLEPGIYSLILHVDGMSTATKVVRQ